MLEVEQYCVCGNRMEPAVRGANIVWICPVCKVTREARIWTKES